MAGSLRMSAMAASGRPQLASGPQKCVLKKYLDHALKVVFMTDIYVYTMRMYGRRLPGLRGMAKNRGKLKSALHNYREQAKHQDWEERRRKLSASADKRHKEQVNSSLRTVFRWSDSGAIMTHDVPFHPNSTVLIVGDGDFSFSLSLSSLLANGTLVPTVYDTEEVCRGKYPGAASNMDELRQRPNVHSVLFGVDACQLPKQLKSLGIDCIVFNFPHTGSGIKDRDRNILGNQKLLLEFFKSSVNIVSKIATSSRGDLITMSASRIGTRYAEEGTAPKLPVSHDNLGARARIAPQIHVSMWSGEPYDSWHVKSLARSCGLQCTAAFQHDFSRYPGYLHCRTSGGYETPDFAKKRAVTYVFGFRPPSKSSKPEARQSDDDDVDD